MSQDPNVINASNPPQKSGEDQKSDNYEQNPPEESGVIAQKEILIQPSTILPPSDIPKETNSGYIGVPLHENLYDYELKRYAGLGSNGIRHGFIRKVYSILMLQLLLTLGMIALFTLVPSIRTFARSHIGLWLYLASYVIFLVVYFVLICSKRASRRFPCNMISLGILTLSMGFMMGMVSAFHKTESVFIAVGITAFVCLGVILFSFQTKYDFTSRYGILCVVLWALLGFGIVCIFTYSRILYTIYAGIGAVLFSIILAIDTQFIVGKDRHGISGEDYIFAVLMLYMDIINIFLCILSCGGGGSD